MGFEVGDIIVLKSLAFTEDRYTGGLRTKHNFLDDQIRLAVRKLMPEEHKLLVKPQQSTTSASYYIDSRDAYILMRPSISTENMPREVENLDEKYVTKKKGTKMNKKVAKQIAESEKACVENEQHEFATWVQGKVEQIHTKKKQVKELRSEIKELKDSLERAEAPADFKI